MGRRERSARQHNLPDFISTEQREDRLDARGIARDPLTARPVGWAAGSVMETTSLSAIPVRSPSGRGDGERKSEAVGEP